MKNFYLIVGPSGSGKTTLANALADRFGYKVIESYTSRPPRYEGEKGHIFVSPDEFTRLMDKYACNAYDGYEYGITGDLIKENDLFVVEPEGVRDILDRYRGEKGIKVIGLNPSVEVLVERMQDRGDSDEKIIRRLAVDAEVFQGLDGLTNIYFSHDIPLDELCEAVHSRIEDFEYVSRHEFSLVDEYGKVISSNRCSSMEEAVAGINRGYPEGLPEGWTVRDDTAKAREDFIETIRKVNPRLKSSHIYVDPTFTDFSWYHGAWAVPFKYDNKQYVYHENYGAGDAWIREVIRSVPNRAGEDILAEKIDFLYKKMEKINRDLEYEDGETSWAAQLEVSLERMENAIPYLEKAVEYIVQKAVILPSDIIESIKTIACDVRKEKMARYKNDLQCRCIEASDEIVKRINCKLNLDAVAVEGWCKFDDEHYGSDHPWDPHTWVEIPSLNLYVDVTADQFNYGMCSENKFADVVIQRGLPSGMQYEEPSWKDFGYDEEVNDELTDSLPSLDSQIQNAAEQQKKPNLGLRKDVQFSL